MDEQNPTMTDLAALLNGHQVTDDEGVVQEETTSAETSAPQETNLVEEAASPEKGAEPEDTGTNPESDETEPELAVDDTGKRYVPQKRFDQVYGEKKQLERELAAARTQSFQPAPPTPQQPAQSMPMDKAVAIEAELLKATLPQFNPESDQYDTTLDNLGFKIYQASRAINPTNGQLEPTITLVEAGRQALAQAKALTAKVAQVKAEARQVKSNQADQGITSRVSNRAPQSNEPGPDATLEEMEAYLKANGQWNKA